MKPTSKTIILLVIVVLLLPGCGGGGDSAAGGDGRPPLDDTFFTVGGTVTGLTGGNLILTHNGTSELTVSMNGAFTFESRFTNGAMYNVTIVAQPDGHDCTVTNGSGTIANGSVTDIVVTCVTTAPPDVTPPEVSATIPANGATAVQTDVVIAVTFSEPMNCTTLTAASFTVTRAGASVGGAVSCNGAVASFDPIAALAFSATYTATVSTAVRDSAGNALAGNHVWSFTTAPPPDTTRPTVVGIDPLPTANGALLTGPVSAVFSEALEPSSVTVNTFVVAGPDGAPVNGTVTLSADGRTATFTPQLPLAFATEYAARLTTAIRDLAGNQLATDKVWRFNTGKQIAAGDAHTCARLVSGAVKCWGTNFSGQLGQGDTNHRGDDANEMGSQLPAIDLGAGRKAVEIVAGAEHSCARLDNGMVKCWGGNGSGQLGAGDTVIRGDEPGEMGDNLPTVDLGTGRVALELAASLGSSTSGGDGHTCARLDDGTIKCWGRNSTGQLGLGHTANRGDDAGEMDDALPAVDLGPGRTAVQIAAGAAHTCALLDDGSVKCWGWNASGQLGLGDQDNRGDAPDEMGAALPPIDLGSVGVVAEIAASGSSTCARFEDGMLKCWGNNGSGHLGLGDTEPRGDDAGEMGNNLPAVNLGTGRVAAQLAVGNIHTCARLQDGAVKCWGYNGEGQHGVEDMDTRGDEPGEMGDSLPAAGLGTRREAREVVSGSFHICARLDDQRVKCWGRNTRGQLGLGDTNNRGDDLREMADILPAVDLGS